MMKNSFIRNNLKNIFKNSIMVSFFSLFLRIFSMGKEIVFAIYFGVSDMLDAYLISVMIPVLISDIFSNGFSSAVMVNYSKIKNTENRKKADEYFSNIILVTFLFLLFLSIMLYLTVKIYIPVFTQNYSFEKRELVKLFLNYLIPLCFFNGMINLFKHYLHIFNKFISPSVINILTPGLVIISVVVYSDIFKVYSAVLGILIGSAFQFVIMYLFIIKNGFKLKFNFLKFKTHSATTTKKFIPLVIGTSFSSLSIAVDNSMASMLPSGSVSLLNYGSKIPALINQLFAYSISTVLFPYFANLYSKHNFNELKKVFYITVLICFFSGLLVCTFVFLYSDFLINLLFNYGNFTEGNTVSETSKVLKAYVFHSLFLLCGMICVKIIISMGKNFMITVVGIQNFVLNIYFNYKLLKYGPSGIAFSTTLVYLFSFLLLFAYAVKELNKIEKN